MVWRRVQVTDHLDLVVTLGSPQQWPFARPRTASQWWGTQRKLGLFFQDRAQQSRVFTIAIAEGFEDCTARILRFTETDTVISCDGEKSEVQPNQKFVYDVGAKRLVSRFAYDRFFHGHVEPKGADGARLTVINDEWEATVDFALNRIPPFRIVGRTEPAPPPEFDPFRQPEPEHRFKPLSPPFGRSREFRLVERVRSFGDTDDANCADAEVIVLETRRAGESIHRIPRKHPECHQIGPWQLVGTSLWFGTTFYGGEGETGVGRFGYFDATARNYRFIAAPQLRDWSTSAILVQPAAVWLALTARGEYGDSAGGIVRFDRAAKTFRRFDIGPSIGQQFTMVGDRLLVAADRGVFIIHDDDVKGYFVDQTSDGRVRVVEGFR